MRREEIWRGFAEAIEGHPFATLEGLAREITDGTATIVYGARSAVFVRWEHDAGVAECGPATGDVDEIVSELRPLIEAEAARIGLREIHIQAGRSGWSRALRPFGYEEAAVILRKTL